MIIKKDYPTDKCPNCGHCEANVYTTNTENGMVNDGDLATCKKCELHGTVVVDDGCADVDYNDYDD